MNYYKLDKNWEYQQGMKCPMCGKTGLWYDNSEEKEATHVCQKCGDAMVIVGSCYARGTKEIKK